MLNTNVVVKPSNINGMGLYTIGDMEVGELIHYVTPLEFQRIKIEDLVNWSTQKRRSFLHYAYCDGVYYYFKEQDDSFYMNHSCEPNCWFQTDNKIVSRRNIKKNEELTIDYATLMSPLGLYESFECQCCSNYCRRTIQNSDCLLPEIINKYEGHFLSFIEVAISNKKILKLQGSLRKKTSLLSPKFLN